MDAHNNAPERREAMVRSVVEGGPSQATAVRRFNVTPKTVAKQIIRFRAEGVGGLRDRSSRPHSSRQPRVPSSRLCADSATSAGRSRASWNIASDRQPHPAPARVRRYGREHPGEIVHIEIKKLGRFNRIGHRITGDRTGQNNTCGVGWEYLHPAIDDHSRDAYSEVLPDEKRSSGLRFLLNTLRFFRAPGVKVQRVMNDNGVSFRSHRYAKTSRLLKIKHLRTRPTRSKPTARPNGANQPARMSLARACNTSEERAAELPRRLYRYNWRRSHGSIGSNHQSVDPV